MSENMMLMAIVDHEVGPKVIKLARAHGAVGATKLLGRGTGVEDIASALHLKIEPKKDIILMVVEEAQARDISEAVSQALNFDAPGTGIIFGAGIRRSSGLLTKQA